MVNAEETYVEWSADVRCLPFLPFFYVSVELLTVAKGDLIEMFAHNKVPS